MFRGLQARLALSHILPIVVLMPFLGFLLLYLLESRYFLSNFASELKGQGGLVAEFTGSDPNVWTNPYAAADTIRRLDTDISAQVSFFDAQGRVLAGSTPAAALARDSTVVQALQGTSHWTVHRSGWLHLGAIDVAIPVRSEQGAVVGVVRLEQQMSQLDQRLAPLRWLIFSTFLFAMLLAVVSALLLAQSLARSLTGLAVAVRQFVPGENGPPIPEEGPEEIRAIAAGFNRLSQRLYDLEQDRKRLLASIVHELGRPLGAVKAAIHALQSDALTDVDFSRELVTGINSQVDQLRLLIDDLTLLVQTEHRPLPLHREPVSLAKVVIRQCENYRYLMNEKQIKLVYETHGNGLVCGDETRLQQILANLLHNAYKYTPVNGQVEVILKEDGESGDVPAALLSVRDTGPGIPPDEQPHIFALFYRSAVHRNTHKGMGIGLAIAQQLAEAHGGALTFESALGQGTTFTLRLELLTNLRQC